METAELTPEVRLTIENTLKKNRAFDIKTATNLQATNLDLVLALNIMEKSGLIVRTTEGRVYMTQKGQEQSNRGFKVSSSVRKFIRFSRNK